MKEAFAQSLHIVWAVFIGIAGIGFLASLVMKGLKLGERVDKKWALEEKEKGVVGAGVGEDAEAKRENLERRL